MDILVKNTGCGLGYSGKGIRTNMGRSKSSKRLIGTLKESLEPELEIVEHENIPSLCSGYYSLIWMHPAFEKIALAQYVTAKEIANVIKYLPKWKYIAQSVAIAKGEWERVQVLPEGSVIYWKYSFSNSFQFRDTKAASPYWKREERAGNDWRYVSTLELNDFRGATSLDRKYYLPSGDEIIRMNWNHNAEWSAAIRRWELNNRGN